MTAEDQHALASKDAGSPGSDPSTVQPRLMPFRFVEQLKRRNVFRVAVLYLVVCWLILEPVHVIFHMLDVPIWANRLVVIAMALGFPAVVIFAWVYEITPEGLKLTGEVPHGQSIRRATGKRLDRAIIAVLAVALAYFVVDKFWLSRRIAPSNASTTVSTQPQPSAVPEKSIAVLPFTDMSENHDQEYFADGMAEEVLDLLAKVPSLRVIARTSSFQFKGKSQNIREVGRELGCTYVLEGSVRKVAGQLRVAAQLIDTRDGGHKWSDSYDRAATDVLNVQREIALALVRALQLEVASSPYASPSASIRSEEAYDAYLHGLHAQEQFDQSGFEEAIADFRHALELDPLLLPAAEGLAFALRNQADWAYVPPQVGWEQARAAAVQAMKLNPESALAHAIRGDVHTEYDWDWPGAERELNSALTLAPRDPRVLMCAGTRNLAVGRWPEAVRLFDAELSADPLDPSAHAKRALVYMRLGRFSEAERDQRRLLEFSPTFGWAHYYLGIVLLQEGRASEALAEMQREAPASGQIAGLAVVYYALNRGREADAALARLKVEHARDWALMIAETYAFRRETDRALEWLDRAYAQKDSALYTVKGDPLLKNIESDPRYKAFLRMMKLPE